MKKLFLLAIGILLTQATFAQMKIGLRAGLSTTEVEPGDLVVFDDGGMQDLVLSLENANYGYHFGIMVQAQIGSFFIMPEVLYNSNTMDYRVQDFRFGDVVNEIRSETYTNLDIPIMMGFKFGPVRLQGGPVGHLFINSQSELTDIDGYEQKFDEMTYGWQAGLGLDVWKFVLDIKYEGNFNRLGDHMTFFGTDLDFDKNPGRIVATFGVAFGGGDD